MPESIVAAAQSAPSSSNLQTWSVVAVQDKGRKARLAELGAGQKHIAQCPLYLVWCVDHSRLHLAAQERQMALGGLDYLEPYVVGVVDASLAAQNAAIALESLGLGFVYIGGMRNHPEEVAATLGLPPQRVEFFRLWAFNDAKWDWWRFDWGKDIDTVRAKVSPAWICQDRRVATA